MVAKYIKIRASFLTRRQTILRALRHLLVRIEYILVVFQYLELLETLRQKTRDMVGIKKLLFQSQKFVASG